MLYVTGIHALNLNCSLLTCGDWHQSAISWANVPMQESTGSLYGGYGIETGKTMPEHEGTYNVANHIRALLDLLVQENYATAQGMNEDFICNDDYTPEVFEKVSMMKGLKNWIEIDRFMGREYHGHWLIYKMEHGL